MLRYPETSGSLVLTVPFGSSSELWFWTLPNQPGANLWPVGLYDARIWVLVANPRVDVSLASLYRVSGLGTGLELYAGSSIGSQNCGTTGPKAFTANTVAQAGVPSSGDRLRLGFTFAHNGGLGSQDVTISFGDPTRDFLEVPILMANPAIVWNGNTLSFPHAPTLYRATPRTDRAVERSAGVVHATGLVSHYDELNVGFDNFEDAQFAADVVAFWSWARRGNQYAFALDTADMVDLDLSGAAAAGQKDIPLADTSSVVVGRRYRLREEVGGEEEIVQVASVTVNVKAVAVNNLKFSYSTGDQFRSPDYFPKMISMDSDLDLTRPRPTTYSFHHRMVEDRG